MSSMPVMREQISIYNYPEHLNPFYKDEQHKRLRFWKVKRDKVNPSTSTSSSSSNSSNLRRSGSFSFGSIKDLWLPFKSFTMKKRSSSLGINKTSESPPSFHRNMTTAGDGEITYIEDSTKYTNYNPHFRRSTNVNNGNSTSSSGGNGNYRASLQNMNQYSNFLDRNTRWRSTIQNGSITPSMRIRYGSENEMKSGISMTSINTNPFDDDYDERSIHSTMTNTSHVRRKKRRAPQPPALKGTDEKVSERNDCDSIKAEGISRLTKDFQNFVMATEEKQEEVKNLKINELRIDELREATPERIPVPVREKFEVLRIDEEELNDKESLKVVKNDSVVIEEVFREVIENSDAPQPTPQPMSPPHQPNDVYNGQKTKQDDLNNLNYSRDDETNEIFSSAVGKKLSEDEKIIFSVVIEKETETAATAVPKLELEAVKADGRKEIINIEKVEKDEFEPEPKETKFDELKNSQQTSSIISTSANVDSTEEEVVYRSTQLTNNNNFERVKVSSYTLDSPRTANLDRDTFLRMSTPIYRPREVTPIPKPRTERDSPTPPTPPARRRSVKDIIESINRNQQLLKLNQPAEDFRTKNLTSISRSNSIQSIQDPQKFQQIASNEKNVELLLDDLQNYQKSS